MSLFTVTWSDFAFVTLSVPTGPPLNMRYAISTATSIRLLWDPPALSGPGSVLYYDISFRIDDESEDTISKRRNSSETSLVVENLVPARDYFFQIAACSLANCGPRSESFLVELVELGTIALCNEYDHRADENHYCNDNNNNCNNNNIVLYLYIS